MRCEECGRVLKNAQMWQLGGDTHAPTSRSMRQLCWECREQATEPRITAAPVTGGADSADGAEDGPGDILAQANDIVREYEARNA